MSPRCARCNRPAPLLVALHGDRGGPDVCIDCQDTVLREAKQRRRDKPKGSADLEAALQGELAFAVKGEIDSDLFTDVLALTHPDGHPPERQEMATRVTARLTELRPYLKLHPPKKDRHEPLSELAVSVHEFVTSFRYPCEICTYTVPALYCDKCRTRWECDQQKERGRENAYRRNLRARRKRIEEEYGAVPRVDCAAPGCDVKFTPKRSDQRFCSATCRQRAHRKETK